VFYWNNPLILKGMVNLNKQYKSALHCPDYFFPEKDITLLQKTVLLSKEEASTFSRKYEIRYSLEKHLTSICIDVTIIM
jgi:hypothetical protein